MRIPGTTSSGVLVMFVITSVWLALVVVSPYLVPEGSLTNLTGTVGVRDNVEAFSELSPVPRMVYTIGDSQCHQIVNRSYFLNGNQMPFCARDLGLFIGLAAGSCFALFFTIRVNPLLFLAGLVPIGIDGGMQALTSYESTNTLRMTTGILAGISLSLLLALFLVTLKEESNRKRGVESGQTRDESGKS